MSERIVWRTSGGHDVLVESEETGLVGAVLGEQATLAAEHAIGAMADVGKVLSDVCNDLLTPFSTLPLDRRPTRVEATLNVALKAGAKILIVKVAGEATVGLKLTYEPPR